MRIAWVGRGVWGIDALGEGLGGLVARGGGAEESMAWGGGAGGSMARGCNCGIHIYTVCWWSGPPEPPPSPQCLAIG